MAVTHADRSGPGARNPATSAAAIRIRLNTTPGVVGSSLSASATNAMTPTTRNAPAAAPSTCAKPGSRSSLDPPARSAGRCRFRRFRHVRPSRLDLGHESAPPERGRFDVGRSGRGRPEAAAAPRPLVAAAEHRAHESSRCSRSATPAEADAEVEPDTPVDEEVREGVHRRDDPQDRGRSCSHRRSNAGAGSLTFPKRVVATRIAQATAKTTMRDATGKRPELQTLAESRRTSGCRRSTESDLKKSRNDETTATAPPAMIVISPGVEFLEVRHAILHARSFGAVPRPEHIGN